MARSAFKQANAKTWQSVPKRTSIGCSSNSRPKNKHKRKGWKKYRGQGK